MAPKAGLILSGSIARGVTGSLEGVIELLKELRSTRVVELNVLLPLLVTRSKTSTTSTAMEMPAIGNFMVAFDGFA